MTQAASTEAVTLPLFPLSSLVQPGGLLPLRLFELRYIDMVKNCFKTDTGFGVCLIREGREAGAPALPYPRGTRVKLIDFDQGADGLLHIMAQGVEEFLLDSYVTQDNGLLVGQVRYLPVEPPFALEPQYDSLGVKLEAILAYVESHLNYPEKHCEESGWVCNRLLELLPLDVATKFRLLTLESVAERLEAIAQFDFKVEFAEDS